MKTFETEHGTLNVIGDAISEAGKFALVVSLAKYRDIIPGITFEYETEDARDTAYESTDQVRADNTAANIYNIAEALRLQRMGYNEA